jgi:hypothetical protein
MADVLVCSFYTPGGYYEECAEKFAGDVKALGLDLHLKRMEVPTGKTWPQICRLKVPFIQEVRQANPGKLLFWIDVDCRLQALPTFIRNTTADLIGFQRGFGQPLSIGYANKARFWEPCFFGFGRSDAATAFIDFAAAAEKQSTFDATDDFFFEEAWRAMAQKLTYQFIPSEMSKPTNPDRFFVFGSSSNVAKYRGKVKQHEAPAGRAVRPVGGSRMVSSLRGAALRHLPEPVIDKIVEVRNQMREAKAKLDSERIIRSALQKPVQQVANRSDQMRTFNIFVKQNLALADEPNFEKVDKMADVLGRSCADVSDTLEWGKAFQDYRNRPGTNRVTSLIWWDTPAPGNFGDWLSPYIFGQVGDTSIRYVKPGTQSPDPHFIGVGSIIKFAQTNSTVLGSGIAARGTKVNPNAKYTFVRGRHTADCIAASGGVVPEIFGDPGIIMSKLYAPDEVVKEPGSVALVRHIRHLPLTMKLPSYIEEISIWGARPAALEDFISKILTKDFVITSAMHCFIVCQSYGIPCALVTFEGLEDVVPGDGIKYLDYLNGVGFPEVMPDRLPTDLRNVDLQNWVRTDRVKQGQIDDVFTMIKSEIGTDHLERE